MVVDFRQGTTGRLEATFITIDGILVDQPDHLPTVEVIYIDPYLLQPVTSIATTLMMKIEPGKYFINWRIPINEPTIEHQIIYRGLIEDKNVIGEDVVTVLPLVPKCVFTPAVLTTKINCGCGAT